MEHHQPQTYVKVGDGLPWVDGPRNHLHQLVRRDTIAHTCKEKCGEGRDKRCMESSVGLRMQKPCFTTHRRGEVQ